MEFYLAPFDHWLPWLQSAVLLTEQEQVANFEKSGRSIAKLDQHLQLQVFLHTMFAVERTEGGYVHIE